METVAQSLNIFERFNRWIQESIMVKLLSIGFLILILLIPASWIDEVIVERQERATEVVQEVSAKWSGSQMVTGPILVIPYVRREVVDLGKEGMEVHDYPEKAFFLPESLNISGTVNPEKLNRGMFDAVVYESTLSIHAKFESLDFKSLSIPEDMIIWKDAYMVMGITDVRGISDSLAFSVGGKPVEPEPSSNIGLSIEKAFRENTSGHSSTMSEPAPSASRNGIIVKLQAPNESEVLGNVTINLKLKGSHRLDFLPIGKTTTVNLSGPWKDPSFDGEFLPVDRKISEDSFKASWKVLHFNRPFSQQWTGTDQNLTGSDFGLKLLLPVDQYQKSIRTSKYSVLIILLTFMALFLVEITQKIRIHPFQYILIGAALTIYYILLLSLSEQLGYNLAYGIASVATVIMVSLYSISFLKWRKLVLLFSTVLVIFYAFIFVIILQQDLSLLLGSIGLFLIIGLLMYFSRRVNWYKEAVV
ncbi:MAG: cell envelope integrity protein CreD [Chryseolinea sp.]